MIKQSRHTEESPINLSNFLGGTNLGVPPTELKPEECEIFQNFFLDPASGKPRTRYPLEKISNSAPAAADITGIFYWSSRLFFVCNQVLYYLDDNNDPQEVGGAGGGTLTGSYPPTFCPFNDLLLIATGGTIESTQMSGTTPLAVSSVTNAPKARYVLQKDSRVLAAGDPDNKDRVYASDYFQHTVWSGAGSDYMDVGYKDGLDVVGLREFRELYITFKRGQSSVHTYFMTDLSSSAPVVRKVSDLNCARTHYAVAEAYGNLYLLEDNTVSLILGTDAQGKLLVDPAVGRQITGQFSSTDSAFAVVYPPDKQIWFVPDPSIGIVYVCHYLFNNVWSVFKFTRHITAAYYNPSDGYLYLGCDDGYVYRYNKNAATFSDEDGSGSTYSYTGILRTKIFGETEVAEQILKDPRIGYECTASGNATLLILSNYGRNSVYSNSFSTSKGYELFGLQDVDLYDTQVGGSNQMYLYDQRDLATEIMRVNLPVENFQFEIRNLSGAITINSIAAKVAISRWK